MKVAEMGQWVRMLITKPDRNLIPETHMVEGEMDSQKFSSDLLNHAITHTNKSLDKGYLYVSWLYMCYTYAHTHEHASTCTDTHMHTNMHTRIYAHTYTSLERHKNIKVCIS